MTVTEPIKSRKTPVRWSDADVEKVWAALPDVIEKNRRRGLTWQIEHAGQVALGPERWKRIPSFATITSSLLKLIAERYPELKRIYPQLESINQLPIDKETFINVIVETRLTRPFDDIVDIWNECIALVPELSLPEVSHAKYIEPDMFNLIQKSCEAWLLPEPEIEAEPVGPRLEDMKSIDLLVAYHNALLRELNGPRPVPEPEVMVDAEVGRIQLSPRLLAQAPINRTASTTIKSLSKLPEIPEAPDASGREKIRISIVDHNVSRTPADFERAFAEHPKFKFKFLFTQIGSTGQPVFKENGYAILSITAPVSWKNEAIKVCGRSNVHISNGSRESINESMRKVILDLETKALQPKLKAA
jgi:hypothetical protein